MSTAAEYDPYCEGDDGRDVHRCDECCGPGSGCWDEPVAPPAGSDPGLGELLGGPAADAMFGLGIIRDARADEVSPAVMVQAVLGAQRLISWAKAQQHRWTAALARPGVAVPVSSLMDSIAHRADESGRASGIPEELVDRAAAGTEVVGDQVWDALLAAEAAGLAEPELSAAWQVAPITARRRIADAQELVDELPDTFAALEQGRIEEIRARIIAETTAVLEPDLRRRAEQVILDRAKRGMCPGDLRRLASKVVADVDPEAAAKRAEQARARRGTGVRNLDDDLARFTADLAAEDATLTHAVLDVLAQAIPPEARQGRGVSQVRADIFADLFTELADTGLIDLRGIHPHTTDSGTDVDSDRTDTKTAGPAGPADTAPTDTDTAPTDTALTDTALTETDTDETGDAAQDSGRGSGPTDADLNDADADPAAAGDATIAHARPSETSTTEPAGADTADSGPAEPGPGRGGPGDCEPERAVPIAAQLLARLRSIDRASQPDPDCERRGGLLSTIRLPVGLRVNLDITVALSTLAGCDDLSARLTGLGVITADTARALAQAAGTVRILATNDPPGPTDQANGLPPNGSPPPGAPPGTPPGGAGSRARPRNNGGIHHDTSDCGTVLDFGRTTYRPPAAVTDRVNTRDQRCRFPGCSMTATRCDHDHRTPWDHSGATCPCNLDSLCRFHHRTKTFTTWTAVRDHRANTLTWTSPLGRVHTDRPAPDLPTGTPMNLTDPPKLADSEVPPF